MSGDYLWDRSGKPDPEVEALEGLLAQLRHRHRELAVPPGHAFVARPRRSSLRRYSVPLGLAAAVVLMVAGTWVGRPGLPAPGDAFRHDSWNVSPVKGQPRLGSVAVRARVDVPADRWLETDAVSWARLRAGDVGMLEVGPGSRLRLVASSDREHRLALERGSIDAFIWASPGRFLVETPSAVAVDLGCAYRLEVDENGGGRLRVTAGWVGFELDGRESLVPRGAVCVTRPGKGPGTPHFENARAAFVEALAIVDRGPAAPDEAALGTLLREARPQDALSLWHLLSRLDPRSTALVYDRLAVLEPPPPDVTRERVLAGDCAALDAWWDRFGFGSVSQFRMWMDRDRD